MTKDAYRLLLGAVTALGFAAVIVILDHKNGEATSVAFKAAEAKGIQHNGLIDRMREMSAQFVTRGNVLSALMAAGICATIYGVFGR